MRAIDAGPSKRSIGKHGAASSVIGYHSHAQPIPLSCSATRTVVTAVQRIRTLELRKAPSVSESLDWARSLVILNAESLDRELVESTLTMLVKHERDLDRVKGALDKVLADL